ncbi:hypothetical protein [Streptomyces sp. OE57]|uniref:hypothetical protein n=1 Tax=Streptomyces lacaronensis TaxID=3379885 RepID=UPI0039B78D4F
MLLRLAYLGVTNAFAMLRLLPMTDRDKDAEILALRHQITVLERQLGKDKIRFTPSDRALCLPRIHPPWSEACTGPHSRRPRSLESALSRSRWSTRHDDRSCCYDWPTSV